jgi:subtilisin family serine protease
VGTPDAEPIVMVPDPDVDLIPQPRASWGLDRIDQRYLPLSKTYAYNNTGEGVNAYVIDTGILPTHWELRGRAAAIYDAVDSAGNGIDCNGHGTHVAGTIGGRTFGVAKKVRLFGVRVLNCQGVGAWSDVIDGVNFVTWHRQQSAQQGYAAVANMSLGGATNRATDAAVRNSIRAGVTYVVAAGNSNADAATYSPAGVSEAITVGATDGSDSRAEFSNYGPILDLFAPGVSIPSAWIGDDLMIATASGTSMAAPHVAGVVALFLQNNRSASPAMVRSAVVGTSTNGVIINPGQESPNRLLFTSY